MHLSILKNIVASIFAKGLQEWMGVMLNSHYRFDHGWISMQHGVSSGLTKVVSVESFGSGE